MTNKLKDWKVIHVNCDLNKLGKNNDPKPISKQVFRFADKQEAISKFIESYKTFDEKSYNREDYSIAALKFYYKEDGIDMLTYLLLHFQNRQYVELQLTNI